MREMPIATYRGSVGISNSIDPGRSGGALLAEMAIYAEHLSFRGRGPFKIVFRPRAIPRQEVAEVYPLLTPTGILSVNPMVSGRIHVRIVTKSRGKFNGADHYWFSHGRRQAGELLDALATAGYPVEREPRRARLMSVEDRKLFD
jgi:hypothetical protein